MFVPRSGLSAAAPPFSFSRYPSRPLFLPGASMRGGLVLPAPRPLIVGPAWRSQLPPSVAMRYRGLGVLQGQTASIAQAAATAAGSTASILVAMGTIGGPVGAVIAGVAALGLALANVFSGCGQTCIEASNLANQAEPLLLQNLNTYLSSPVHYQSLQAAAANNFNLTWNALTQACGNPQLGSAGQNCISNRQRGACQWKASPGGWSQSSGSWVYTPYGPAGSGTACWNWFTGYLDPIINDPTVVPDPSPAAGITSALTSGSVDGIPLMDLLIPAALLAAVLLL